MQQRKDEILAKKAKLAELKRQRELRQSQGGGRASSGSDVRNPLTSPLQDQANQRAVDLSDAG